MGNTFICLLLLFDVIFMIRGRPSAIQFTLCRPILLPRVFYLIRLEYSLISIANCSILLLGPTNRPQLANTPQIFHAITMARLLELPPSRVSQLTSRPLDVARYLRAGISTADS